MTQSIFNLPHRACLIVSGAEAQDFLNDLLTLNITSLAIDEVRAGALLTPQGRVLFDLLVSRKNGDFRPDYRLECDRHRRDALVQKLHLYRLRRQVEIVADDAAVSAAIGTPESDAWLKDSRVPTANLWRAYTDTPSNNTADITPYHAHRYRHAIAEGANELPPERALPLEARLDEQGGVALDKGCFIGQEVTARTHYRGKLKHRYLPFTASKNFAVPCDITKNQKPIGEVLGLVQDGTKWRGLARMRPDALNDALDDSIPIHAGAETLDFKTASA